MASLFRPPESHRAHSNTPKLKLPSLINNVETPSPNTTIFESEDEPLRSVSNKENLSISVSTTQRSTSNNIYNTQNIYSNTMKKQNQNNLSIFPANSTKNGSSSLSIPVPSPSPSLSPSRSPISLKKRPIPPPIPQLNMNITPSGTPGTPATSSVSSAKQKRPPPLMHPNELSESMKNISIKSSSESSITAPTSMNPKMVNNISANKSPYLRDDVNDSTDSYFSNILSTYEDKGSNGSTNTSSQKNSPLSTVNGTTGTPTETLDSMLSEKDVDQLDESIWKYSNMRNQIVNLGMLGEGAGGSVAKCRLKTGNRIFALKTINTLNTDPEFQKQIFRELQFNRSFKSNYIVRYYGMFRDELNSSIYIAMEYMGGKSLEAVYKNLLARGGRIGEKVLGKIAEDVLRGLSYLHEKKVIHRDIKPQNILFNDGGEVKLCDFGVSGEAVNSLATTFTGTSFYMAPERIQGEPYSVTCDVWSLGLTILEVAQGHFPFGSDKITANIAPIELLVMILTFTPELKDEPENNISWSNSFKSFIGYCLKKDPRERPSPRQMLKHPWIQGQMKKKVNMAKFIKRCWENE
ncbi:MAP kinase kinase Mkk2p/SSP33 [Monosporozyma unispora]|nr:Protein kinase C signaling pathway involved MAPKK protein [Kazachstania unispora]